MQHASLSPAIEVPAFSLIPDYIDEAEERSLLAHIDAEPCEHDWQRRIQQYGLGYAGEIGSLASWLRDLPGWLAPVAQSIVEDGYLPLFPENCVVNDHEPGVGIGPHRDYKAFGPSVACVSLGSDIVLDL